MNLVILAEQIADIRLRLSELSELSDINSFTAIRNLTTNPYQLTVSDQTLFVDTSTAKTVVLPDATLYGGRLFRIKDSTGNAGVNNITINSLGGNIDGSPSYIMNTNYQAVTIQSNGLNWYLI